MGNIHDIDNKDNIDVCCQEGIVPVGYLEPGCTLFKLLDSFEVSYEEIDREIVFVCNGEDRVYDPYELPGRFLKVPILSKRVFFEPGTENNTIIMKQSNGLKIAKFILEISWETFYTDHRIYSKSFFHQ